MLGVILKGDHLSSSSKNIPKNSGFVFSIHRLIFMDYQGNHGEEKNMTQPQSIFDPLEYARDDVTRSLSGSAHAYVLFSLLTK